MFGNLLLSSCYPLPSDPPSVVVVLNCLFFSPRLMRGLYWTKPGTSGPLSGRILAAPPHQILSEIYDPSVHRRPVITIKVSHASGDVLSFSSIFQAFLWSESSFLTHSFNSSKKSSYICVSFQLYLLIILSESHIREVRHWVIPWRLFSFISCIFVDY